MIWRVLIAVIAVTLTFLLVPPLFRTLGLPLTGDLALIIKVCVAALAIFYILRGKPIPPIP